MQELRTSERYERESAAVQGHLDRNREGLAMQHPANSIAPGVLRSALIALGRKPNLYADTVRHPEAAERRRKNKAARKARRANRKH